MHFSENFRIRFASQVSDFLEHKKVINVVNQYNLNDKIWNLIFLILYYVAYVMLNYYSN
jgi:hypothetical protein